MEIVNSKREETSNKIEAMTYGTSIIYNNLWNYG